MRKLELPQTLSTNLQLMIQLLYPNQKLEKVYGDGMLAFKCPQCKRVTHIHWYELLIDHILVSIAQDIHPANWKPVYIDMLTAIMNLRMGKALTPHPVYVVYNTYFSPNRALIIEAVKNKPPVMHSH